MADIDLHDRSVLPDEELNSLLWIYCNSFRQLSFLEGAETQASIILEERNQKVLCLTALFCLPQDFLTPLQK